MTVTMREVVEDALEEIGVKTAEVPITDDELQSGIRRCNDMLTEWSDSGVISGYSPLYFGDDELNVDRSSVRAIKLALAINLASPFQKVISPTLTGLATGAYNSLLASNSFIGKVAFPDTLPMGSGNDCGDFYQNDRFFSGGKEGNFQ